MFQGFGGLSGCSSILYGLYVVDALLAGPRAPVLEEKIFGAARSAGVAVLQLPGLVAEVLVLRAETTQALVTVDSKLLAGPLCSYYLALRNSPNESSLTGLRDESSPGGQLVMGVKQSCPQHEEVPGSNVFEHRSCSELESATFRVLGSVRGQC